MSEFEVSPESPTDSSIRASMHRSDSEKTLVQEHVHPSKNHSVNAGPLQNLSHPVHHHSEHIDANDEHIDDTFNRLASTKFSLRPLSISSSVQDTLASSASSLSGTTLIDKKDTANKPRRVSIFKSNLLYWVHKTFIRKKYREAAQHEADFIDKPSDDFERIFRVIQVSCPEAQHALIGQLAKDLTEKLGLGIEQEQTQHAFPIEGAEEAVTVLAEICDGSIEQMQQVLKRCDKPFDIRAANPSHTAAKQDKIVEEKAWRFIEQLASAKEDLLAIALQLQKIKPDEDCLKGVSENAARVVYLQARHKLRALYPELTSTPGPISSYISSDLRAKQACQAMEAAQRIIYWWKTRKPKQDIKAIDSPHRELKQDIKESDVWEKSKSWLSHEYLTSFSAWQQGFDESQPGSPFYEGMIRLTKPFTVHLERAIKRFKLKKEIKQATILDSIEARGKLFADDLFRTANRKKILFDASNLLTSIDYVANLDNSSDFNHHINAAIDNLLLPLSEISNHTRDPVELANTVLTISTLTCLQKKLHKGTGHRLTIEEKDAEYVLRYAYHDLINQRTHPDLIAAHAEARNIIRAQAWQKFLKLTDSPYRFETIRKEIRKLLVFFWVSPPASEELFTLAGVKEFAEKLAPQGTDPEPEWKQHFTENIKNAEALLSKPPMPLHTELPKVNLETPEGLMDLINGLEKHVLEFIETQPSGNAHSISEASEIGFSAAFLLLIQDVLLPLLPTIGPDLAYVYGGPVSHEIKIDQENSFDFLFGKGADHSGRLGLVTSIGVLGAQDLIKGMFSASGTLGAKGQIKRIKSFGLRAHDHENAKEMVRIYFKAIRKALQANSAGNLTQEEFIRTFADGLFVELLGNKQISAITTKFKSERGDGYFAFRAGDSFGYNHASAPTFGPSGGVTVRKAYTRERRYEETGPKQKIAKGSEEEFKVDAMASLGLRFFGTTIRIPIQKTLFRKTLVERQRRERVLLKRDPSNPFHKQFSGEREAENSSLIECSKLLGRPEWNDIYGQDRLADFLGKPSDAAPNSRYTLTECWEMRPDYAKRYRSWIRRKAVLKVRRKQLRARPRTKNNQEEIEKISAHIEECSARLATIRHNDNAWKLVGLRASRKIAASSPKGLSLIAKLRYILSEKLICEERRLYPIDQEQTVVPNSDAFTAQDALPRPDKSEYETPHEYETQPPNTLLQNEKLGSVEDLSNTLLKQNDSADHPPRTRLGEVKKFFSWRKTERKTQGVLSI